MSNFMSIKNELDSLQAQKEKILLDAGNKVASVMMSMNKSGESNPKKIQSDLEKLISPFNKEERVQILLRAASIVIANL